MGWATGNRTDRAHTYALDVREFYLLWLVATLAYGVGDLLTTVAVLARPGFVEANGVVRLVIEQFGLPGIVGAKVLCLVLLVWLGWTAARTGDRLLYYFFPLLTLVVGVGLTAFNGRLLLG